MFLQRGDVFALDKDMDAPSPLLTGRRENQREGNADERLSFPSSCVKVISQSERALLLLFHETEQEDCDDDDVVVEQSTMDIFVNEEEEEDHQSCCRDASVERDTSRHNDRSQSSLSSSRSLTPSSPTRSVCTSLLFSPCTRTCVLTLYCND
eukprot:m.164569 g.164569  ORF g.164569 m.164569 type:complete len:152 (+) comp13426_c1_seq7:197-652(+)